MKAIVKHATLVTDFIYYLQYYITIGYKPVVVILNSMTFALILIDPYTQRAVVRRADRVVFILGRNAVTYTMSYIQWSI